MQFTALLFTLLASGAALAAPSTRATKTRCDVSSVTIPLPSSQPSGTPLATPIAGGPKFIGIGVGVQNYTCGTTGTYTNVGALAEIFDISCFSPDDFDVVTDLANEVWQAAPKDITAAEVIDDLAEVHPAFVLGQHFFIPNPAGSGLSPKWDFTSASEAGNPNAFVVGAKTGDIPDPTDPSVNIDWLSLKPVEGELADQIYRIQTRNGQPPSSCTPGSPEIFVRYVAQYWFYGGEF
ncbi:hypothetical protein EIP86_005924 [Pleurotus ostreatoroseus]|nr:hypothetical protein EIP86_005924 [Pleurotus ostreatoroseus]